MKYRGGFRRPKKFRIRAGEGERKLTDPRKKHRVSLSSLGHAAEQRYGGRDKGGLDIRSKGIRARNIKESRSEGLAQEFSPIKLDSTVTDQVRA